ncbi:MAG: hypothetical protein SFY81_09950 [Verrucomicrobiota bacterium]|nr:hypothetical protein [Verrucomicrobiota bacterium]
MKIWKVIIAVAVIFSAGFITGNIASRTPATPPERRDEPPRNREQGFLSKMDKELDLTDEQEKKLNVILKASRQRMDEIWSDVQPRIDTEFKETRLLILAELTPEQQKQFEEKFKPRPFGPRRGPREKTSHDKDHPETTSQKPGHPAPPSN